LNEKKQGAIFEEWKNYNKEEGGRFFLLGGGKLVRTRLKPG